MTVYSVPPMDAEEALGELERAILAAAPAMRIALWNRVLRVAGMSVSVCASEDSLPPGELWFVWVPGNRSIGPCEDVKGVARAIVRTVRNNR